MTLQPTETTVPHDSDPAPFDNRDLSSRIYQVLRREIFQGQLRPGFRLSLDDLAERFGVSVSPIRDALRLLAADGLVELRSRRGAFVTQPSPSDIQAAYQFRAILECAAVDWVLAAGPPAWEVLRSHIEAMPATMTSETPADYMTYSHHDEGFHKTIVSTIGNNKLAETYAGLLRFTLIARMLHRATSQRATKTLAEHHAILTALTAGDAPTAREAICTHLHNACDYLVRRGDDLADGTNHEQSESGGTDLGMPKQRRGVRQRATPRRSGRPIGTPRSCDEQTAELARRHAEAE